MNQQPKPTIAINNPEATVTEAAKPKSVQGEAKPPIESAPTPPVQQSDPTPVQPPQSQVSIDKQALMTAAGIPESEWAAVDYIISHESGWRTCVVNGGSIDCAYTGNRAYGLCQSLPASKMSSAGADYQSNPLTQLLWCNNYAQSRYGGWNQALAFWQKNRWW